MTIDHIVSAERFITAYREIEKGAPELGEDLIKHLEKRKATAQHLCISWKSREQDWGSFYLNLSHDFQYKILRFWGMGEPAGDKYAQQVAVNPRKMLFASAPDSIMWPHELLKFFNNHGIDAIPKPGINLTQLPADDRRYGNSANWGDYILSLPGVERERVLQLIAVYAFEKRSINFG